MMTGIPPGDLIGRSGALDAVRTQIRRLARISETGRLPSVLLLGETGTGKGMVASLLHRTGRRAAGPFIDVNCAAIPATLLESELFGFERGAFTDARASKAGLFEAAHRGTLFLDEIGELPDGLQVKLLTAIESRQVRRLGSTRSEPVDVWIIAATSTDLSAAMRTGRFRHELYHRLSTVVLELPPLRARDRDVLDLADYFLARAAAEHGIAVKELADDARAALLPIRGRATCASSPTCSSASCCSRRARSSPPRCCRSSRRRAQHRERCRCHRGRGRRCEPKSANGSSRPSMPRGGTSRVPPLSSGCTGIPCDIASASTESPLAMARSSRTLIDQP
jgi:sigma54-dependent transcription regulator